MIKVARYNDVIKENYERTRKKVDDKSYFVDFIMAQEEADDIEDMSDSIDESDEESIDSLADELYDSDQEGQRGLEVAKQLRKKKISVSGVIEKKDVI